MAKKAVKKAVKKTVKKATKTASKKKSKVVKKSAPAKKKSAKGTQKKRASTPKAAKPTAALESALILSGAQAALSPSEVLPEAEDLPQGQIGDYEGADTEDDFLSLSTDFEDTF